MNLKVAEELARRHHALAARSGNPADSTLLQVDQAMRSVNIKNDGLKAAQDFLIGEPAGWCVLTETIVI